MLAVARGDEPRIAVGAHDLDELVAGEFAMQRGLAFVDLRVQGVGDFGDDIGALLFGDGQLALDGGEIAIDDGHGARPPA
jgi:hypothetical protein